MGLKKIDTTTKLKNFPYYSWSLMNQHRLLRTRPRLNTVMNGLRVWARSMFGQTAHSAYYDLFIIKLNGLTVDL